MVLIPAPVKQFFNRHYGPRPIVGLAAVGVLALIVIFFENWVFNSAIPYTATQIRAFLARPIGFFVFAFLVYLAAFVLLAFLDVSPIVAVWRRRKRPPVHVPLTPEERDAIQEMRVLWNLKAQEAATRLHDLFASAIVWMQQNNRYWWDVLPPYRDELRDAGAAVHGALNSDAQVPVASVRDSFNRLYRAYVRAVKWLARFDQAEFRVAEDLPEAYKKWHGANKAFHEELERVNERLEFKDKLTIHIENSLISEFVHRQ